VPRLSVWYLRAALVYLGFGLGLGALMLAAPALKLPASVLRLRPLHAEMLLLGWMVQLGFGVAYWILPRQRGEAARRGERLAFASLILLNFGVWAAGIGMMFGIPTVPRAGRAAELLGVLAFGLQVWPRVRAASVPPRA
jgi:cbb3-type cytochrome oxidase subunit 1